MAKKNNIKSWLIGAAALVAIYFVTKPPTEPTPTGGGGDTPPAGGGGGTPPTNYYPLVYNGYAPEVKELQTILGFTGSKVDGYFGQNTFKYTLAYIPTLTVRFKFDTKGIFTSFINIVKAAKQAKENASSGAGVIYINGISANNTITYI